MLNDMNPIKLLDENSPKRVERAFSIHANTLIKQINVLIEAYNQSFIRDKQLATLYQINSLRKTLEDQCPQDVIIQMFINEIQDKLFIECRQQFIKFNISMHEQSLAENEPFNPIPKKFINPFADMIANMQPDDVRQVLSLLAGDEQHPSFSHDHPIFIESQLKKLKQLFKSTNTKYHLLINSHGMGYLGGGNSQNYLFTSNNTSIPLSFIVRVDNRLGGAREMDTYLRNSSLADILTPVEAVRTLTFNGKTNSLLVTTLCPASSLDIHSRQHKNDNDKISTALNIYSQMGIILARLNKENCFFPDSKNTNWLLNEHDNLVISDTKSLLFSDNGHYDYDKMYDKNQWILGAQPQLIVTNNYIPPEIREKQFNIDQIHSYILGKNLYQYLTECNNSYFNDKHNATQLCFNKALFNTPEGKMLQTLLGKVIIHEPGARARMSIKGVVKELNHIKNYRYCLASLNAMELDSKESDTLMRDFINRQRQIINMITPVGMKELASELKKITKKIQLSNQFIQLTCNNLKKATGHSIWRDGALFKAKSIEKTFYNIPVEQRGIIMTTTNPSPEINALREALGTWRATDTAAKSTSNPSIYQKYKKQYFWLRNNESTAENSSNTFNP